MKFNPDNGPFGGDIPCPWGEYLDRFPQGKTKNGVVELSSFKAIAYEIEAPRGQYGYQTLASGKVDSVPVLMCINIFSDSPVQSFEPDYYQFKNVVVKDGLWVVRKRAYGTCFRMGLM